MPRTEYWRGVRGKGGGINTVKCCSDPGFSNPISCGRIKCSKAVRHQRKDPDSDQNPLK